MAVRNLENFEFTVSHALYNDYNNVRIVAWAFEKKKNNSPQNVGRSGVNMQKEWLKGSPTFFYEFFKKPVSSTPGDCTRLAVISYDFGFDLSSRNMRRC